MKLKEKRIGCVTLLVSDDERSERKGFIVDGQEPVYSIARIPRLHLEGRATVDAHSYFADKLHAYATECLDEYANANMDSTAFYNCSAFWADALLRAGDNATPRVMVFFQQGRKRNTGVFNQRFFSYHRIQCCGGQLSVFEIPRSQ